MELISDYIFLRNAEQICKNLQTDCDFLKDRTQRLLKIYRKMMFKIGLFDLSLAILEKDMKVSGKNVILSAKIVQKIEFLEQNLSKKMSEMKLNDFEKKYALE